MKNKKITLLLSKKWSPGFLADLTTIAKDRFVQMQLRKGITEKGDASFFQDLL